MNSLELCLVATVGIILVADLAMALSLRFVLPYHLTQPGYYPADGRKLSFHDAVKICPCLARVFPHGTHRLISFKKVEERSKLKSEAEKAALAKRGTTTIEPNVTETLAEAEAGLLIGTRRAKRYAKHQGLGNNLLQIQSKLGIRVISKKKGKKQVICQGVIKSIQWLVTTRECARTDTGWFVASVTSKTGRQWSKVGSHHYVTDYKNLTGELVALKVLPKFSEQFVPPVKNYSFKT